MAETRRRLLEAAITVFARKGYEGASVKEIADEAGYTIGAIYAHFDTKQELFLALLRERYATKVDDLTGIMGREDSLEGQLDALADRFGRLRELEGDWDLLATEFALYAARHPEARGPLIERQRLLREGLAELVRARLTDMGIEPATSVELIATAIIALGDGLGAMGRLEPSGAHARLFSQGVYHLVAGFARQPVE